MTGVPFKRLLPLYPNARLAVEIAFGADLTASSATWSWTDVTTYVMFSGVSITLGRSDEASQASPADCKFKLLNSTGNYSPYNPIGIYYPNVRRNTPVRVRITLDGALWYTRFFGFANGFTPAWDTSARLAVVTVSASGVLRRLTQGKTPLRSPLYRAIADSAPLAYWPLEDGVDSTQAASGLVGGGPMVVDTGVMDFVNESPVGGGGSAKPQVTAENSLSAAITGASSTAWQVSVWTRGVTDGVVTFPYYVPLEVRTDTGIVYRLVLQSFTTDDVSFARYESEAATSPSEYVGTTGDAAEIDGQWHLVQATIAKVGADAAVSLYYDGQLFTTETWVGLGNIGRPVRISGIGRFGGTGAVSDGMTEIQIAHIALWNTASLVAQYDAGLGYVGETATERLVALCDEQGVPLTITATSSAKMGAQKVGSFVDLLRECETADSGVLCDGLTAGLSFFGNFARYNQTAALTLDVAAGQVGEPFAPVDDDQRNRNLVKVDRKGGSSATYSDTSGPLGTNTIGIYDTSLTVNAQGDAVLLDRASWEVHKGTVEGLRYPSLNVDLAAVPAVAAAWLETTLNERIDVTNVTSKATQHPPGTVSLLLEGYTEKLTPLVWSAACNCSPFAPYRVFVLGTDRLDADSSSQLVSGISASAVSFQVQTAATRGALWTTSSAEWTSPKTLYVEVGGEQMRVTNITGAASPQTFTVVRGVNGITKTHSAGAHVGLWQPRVLAL